MVVASQWTKTKATEKEKNPYQKFRLVIQMNWYWVGVWFELAEANDRKKTRIKKSETFYNEVIIYWATSAKVMRLYKSEHWIISN